MPLPMPYYLEKGPFFSVLEDYINGGTTDRLVVALRALRRGDALDSFEVFGSATLRNPNQPTPADWVIHLNRHWFGKHRTRSGTWKQPKFDAVKHPQTGYWQGYYGDVEGITRTTLIRMLEVVLGVEHTDDPKKKIVPTRHWHVDFLWKCSQTWFEGWVTWRRTGAGQRSGHVTVLFATPPVAGTVVLDSPLIGAHVPEFTVDPVSTASSPKWGKTAEAKQGMWVITHTLNKGYVIPSATTSIGTPSGKWPSPLPGRVHSTGKIVTVAPALADGGVLAQGVKYTAATGGKP